MTLSSPVKSPNVLWIMADQHNANCLGSAGHPNIKSPHLDSIAENGTRFNMAYCNNPICGPSRCSFLSGQYVKSHGISGNFIRDVQRTAPNLAECFKDAGYQTALIGKAHLPKEWVDRGFEHIRLSDLADASPEDPCSCDYFNELVESGMGDLYDQGWLPEGHPGHGMRSFISELPEEKCLEAWTGREAIKFLRQRDRSHPFFMKVSFQRPHDPYAPPRSKADLYDPSALNLPENADDYLENKFAGKPDFMTSFLTEGTGSGYPYRSEDSKDLKLQMSRHFALISMIDDEVGRIVDELKSAGDWENTVIVYVADHGDFAGEHGLMLKNLGIYESIHRIPFIISGPGIRADQVLEAMTESIDLFPTLMEIANLPLPDGLDGRSLLGLLHGKPSAAARSQTICEWDFPVSPQTKVYAIRDERYRLVIYDELPEEGELYDHENDPGEMENQFDNLAYAQVRQRLLRAIVEYREDGQRIHTPKEDLAARQAQQDMPTRKIHTRGFKWSQIAAIQQIQD